MAPDTSKSLAEAKKLSASEPAKAETIYRTYLKDVPTTDAALKDYEIALMGLGELYRDHQ
jgi:26S proteasome regulatory subunit N6